MKPNRVRTMPLERWMELTAEFRPAAVPHVASCKPKGKKNGGPSKSPTHV